MLVIQYKHTKIAKQARHVDTILLNNKTVKQNFTISIENKISRLMLCRLSVLILVILSKGINIEMA